MPELPEVETIVRELSKKIIGYSIINIQIINPKLRYPIPLSIQNLTHTILSVTRKAKYILVTLDNSEQIIIHLGMTGKILIENILERRPQKHDHLVIELNNNTSIIYNDTRKFGFVTTSTLAPKSVFLSASDPLEKGFSLKAFAESLQHSTRAIKTCLMDNKIITGVGNIYANEALFKAKILPTRIANRLSREEINTLLTEIQTVLIAAIKAGGSSIKDYRNSSNSLGYFQRQHLVYGREKQPCKCCNNPIERLVISGRSSFFCRTCQK